MSTVTLLTVAAVLALGGCTSTPPTPPVGPLESEGFETFVTPRSFDGPGTIFRIDAEKKRYPVAEITFKVREGEEALPKYSSSRVLAMNNLLEALGASTAKIPASIKANLSRTTTVSIEASTGRRQYVRDDDLTAALRGWATQAKPTGESVYYLIRETISTPELSYKVDKNWLASAELDVKVLKAAGYSGDAKVSGGDILEMNRTFSKPLNVWFKAEKIVIRPALGAGPGQYLIERTPISASILGL
ncbi:hypothetical protein GCM10007933_24040 [Zoogloea oryzae]|uniref:DUF3108 domain-containing protein n=1 Tax=Zoogloea oryzae TaxID=310767 RepID=A0ABQ6FBG8_9RHOO|nr:hypothetical protein [Zoogloea oryzae]GLT22943.1 hypothetical protein GCM10007933_24040 [Zoogloea oryzae]